MAKRYPKHLNQLLLAGKVEDVRLWDGQYPNLSVTVDGTRVKVSIKKDGPFYAHHQQLKGRHVLMQAGFDSWEKEGQTNYGLRCSEGSLSVCHEQQDMKVQMAMIVGRVQKSKPWPAKGALVYNVETRYKVPNKNEWRSRFIRVLDKKEYPDGSFLFVTGTLEFTGHSPYVSSLVSYRVD